MGTFETADGHINLAAAGSEMFRKFCVLIEREGWLAEEKFASSEDRFKNRDALRAQVADVMRTRTNAEWIRDCNAAGLPCGQIYSMMRCLTTNKSSILALPEVCTLAPWNNKPIVEAYYYFRC